MQRNQLDAAFQALAGAYYRLAIGQPPEILAGMEDPDMNDVKVGFTITVDSQAVYGFLKKMKGISNGDSHQDFKAGGRYVEFHIFEQNRNWILTEHFRLRSKCNLELLAGAKVIASQELGLQVELAWDDLLSPPITWTAQRPGADSPEQRVSVYYGTETGFVFRDIPRGVAETVTGARIIRPK